MSARSRAIQQALAEARGAIVFGRTHVVVLADRDCVRQLPDMLRAKLEDEIDTLIVQLAGTQETVADVLVSAMRDARHAAGPAAADRRRSRSALLLPDALSIPPSSLRELHELSNRIGPHRLVLLVDRDANHHGDDPVMELVARLGTPVATVEVDLPAPEPVQVPTLEDLLGSKPADAPEPEPEHRPEPEPTESAPELAEAEEKEPQPEASRDEPTRVATPEELAAALAAESAPPPEPVARPVSSEPIEEPPSRPPRASSGSWLRIAGPALAGIAAAVVAVFVAAPGAMDRALVWMDTQTSSTEGLRAESQTAPAPAEPAAESDAAAVQPASEAAIADATAVAPDPPAAAIPEPAPPAAVEPPATPKRVAKVPRVEPARSKAAPPAAPRAPAPRRSDRPKRRAAAPPAAAPATPMRVNFNAAPWANLELDGRRLGPTPLADVRVRPGEHEVVATFPDGRVVRRRIQVNARQTRFQIR